MKKTFKKSTVFFMALAVFAMIFIGCSKKDDSSSSSSSSSGGDGGGGSNPPTGDYGTIQLGLDDYDILIGGYELYYDEDLQANVAAIVLSDSEQEDANSYAVIIPFQTQIPEGTFTYTVSEEPVPGQCGGIFRKGSNSNLLMCVSGNVTITKVDNEYSIVSEGQASNLASYVADFSVNFRGPLTNMND